MKLIFFLLFVPNVYSQLNYGYTVSYDTISELKEQTRHIEAAPDKNNLAEIMIGSYFNDSVQVFVNDSLIFEGLIKTNASASIADTEFVIDKINTWSLKIVFNNTNVLEFPYDRNFRFLRIDRRKEQFSLVYYNRKRLYN